LRISVLAYQLRVGGALSVGRNVVAALARVADDHEYQFILPAGAGYEDLPKPSCASCVYYRRPAGAIGQLWFEGFHVPGLVRAFSPQVVWGMANSALRRPQAKQAILFHKPQFIYGPEQTRLETRWIRWRNELARRRLRAHLKSTQLVFCQTSVAAERFRRCFDYGGRIAIMPNAVSRQSRAGSPQERPAALRSRAGRFTLFCLTRYYAHKNLEALCETFERHGEALRDVAVVLTIAPGQHPRAALLLERIARPGLREHFINVGPLRQDELAAYYAHTDGLILPTLLESFSGSYLEAMQFGRPILTSDFDFAREVCGPAALYFDPFDPADICRAIRELRDHPERATALIEAGQTRLRTYVRDWDAIVRDAVGELCAIAG